MAPRSRASFSRTLARSSGIVADETAPTGGAAADDGTRLAAGDRLPDLRLVHLDGRATSTHRAVGGIDHVVLVLAGDGRAQATGRLVPELGRMLASRPGIPARVALVHAGTTGAQARNDDIAVLRDPDGAAHDRFGAAGPTLLAVRPDGYVGLRSEPPDPAARGRYLDRLVE